MEFIHFLLELLTHTKDVLLQLFQQYGPYIYAILFLIIFVETGLVIMPFLPGDSFQFIYDVCLVRSPEKSEFKIMAGSFNKLERCIF